jgi:hypothetical protein
LCSQLFITLYNFSFGPDDLTKVLPEQKLQKSSTLSCEIATETAHPFRLCDLEAATKNFANRIGSGGFGIVYYGKLSDGREIAVKVPTNDSYQGKKQFTNEVGWFANQMLACKMPFYGLEYVWRANPL